METIEPCCEDFESLITDGWLYVFNNKPTLQLAQDMGTYMEDTLEVSFTHCPFCGEEVDPNVFPE